MPAPGIWWLSRDLRLDDNPALLAAIAAGPLLPVFVIDQLTLAQGAASRWRLAAGLRALDQALRARSGGQGLVLLRGEPERVLPRLAKALGVRDIHQSDWPAPQMRALQARVAQALQPVEIGLQLYPGHLLTHPHRIKSGTGGAYKVYSAFKRALYRVGPEQPVPDAPARIAVYRGPLPDLGQDASLTEIATLDLAPDLHRGRAALEQFALAAGEAAARDQLDAFLDHAAAYPAGRDRPDLSATSNLSEHLALGEISPRRIWAIASLRADLHPEHAGGIAQFLSEVIWREFAWHLLIDFPQMPSQCWRAEWQSFPWRQSGGGLHRWQRAETGVPLVDAGLREMWLTGRMHNRVRMVVASWLTKHLLTSWQAGLAHFEDCLTDWDPAANAMNWQWVAGCGPDASPYFRVFNPQTQREKLDPKGVYCRRWLAGYEGASSAEAQLFAQTTPRAWQSAPVWRAGPASDLTEGRTAALEALANFRSMTKEM